MKRMISLIAIISLVSMAGFAKGPVASGKTNCCLGNYVIEKASNPIMVDGKALTSFVISYENSDKNITVGIDDSNKKCTTYIVQSDELTVQYDCDSKFFGVNILSEKYMNSGLDGDDDNLNRMEYFHQKVLTQGKMTEIEHIKLISVFYPRLIMDYDEVFAVK